jgi:hypothetical protein
MPYQSSPSFSADDDRAFESYINDSIAPTQPASNITSTPTNHVIHNTNNTPIQHYRSHTHSSYSSNVPITLQTPTISSPSTAPIFNNEYSCRSVLAKTRVDCLTDQDYFKQLYCMYSGCEGTVRSRIQVLLDTKESSLSRRFIKVIKRQSADELLRRYSYLRLKERGIAVGISKSFRPANKSLEELNSLFKSAYFHLPVEEKLYLEFEMEPFVAKYERDLKNTLKMLQEQGSEISKNDLRKMRLWEAIFLDSKYMRDKLVTLKDSMSRHEIDARNSKAAPVSLFHLAAEKYNDANWEVYTRVMPDLHEKFRSPVRLSLMIDEEKMTEVSAKNAYTDAKGKLNVALANWKRSGNGKGNIKAKVKGLGYGNYINEENHVTFVDDDRFKFVNQLNIAYFWSLCEITGLTQQISQNCTALNIVDTTGRSVTSGPVRGRTASVKGNSGKRKIEDEQSDALFAMVTDIKQGFIQQTNEFKQSSLTSQILDAEEALTNL